MSQEQSPETIREVQNYPSAGNATQREDDGSATVLEVQPNPRKAVSLTEGSKFHDYLIVRQLPSTSTEADTFVIEKDGSQFFLKLYRFGINPKIDILKSVKALGEKYPKNFIKIFETDFDAETERWFEVQEYVTSGSLQAVIDKLPQTSQYERNQLFSNVVREAGEALHILHENGFLHRDVKPSNILVRSLDPLNLVVIDFGIASTLEADMSKKATRFGGTPMYQSPESFSSVADVKTGERRVVLGSPTDWWGLGMILLEIAVGIHPFKGLSSNVIAYSLATEAVNIPSKVDARQKELLKGLLTRNPEKRWGWEQVSRWLKGERGIPNFFDEAAGGEGTRKRRITFMGQKYATLEELANAFVKDEDSWIKGREFLLRGHVRQWLESNQDFDTAIDLVNSIANISDSDEKVFRFINTYGGDLPFVFGGHAMTVNNLFIFTAKAQKRETMTDMEKKVVDMLLNGRLLSCYESYIANKTVSDNTKLFLSLLMKFKDKDLAVVSAWLNFYMNPNKYHCPFLRDVSSIESVIKASDALTELPMTVDEWNRFDSEFVVPSEIFEQMRSANTYSKAISALNSMTLMTKEEWNKLNAGFILPEKLVIDTNSIGRYQRAITEIRTMRNSKLLFLRSKYTQADNATKKELASSSIDDYKRAVYRVQWGYDDDSVAKIESSLSEMRYKMKFSSGFEEARCNIWVAYLEYLSSKSVPLTDEDKKILRNVSLRNTDELEKRISAIVG